MATEIIWGVFIVIWGVSSSFGLACLALVIGIGVLATYDRYKHVP